MNKERGGKRRRNRRKEPQNIRSEEGRWACEGASENEKREQKNEEPYKRQEDEHTMEEEKIEGKRRNRKGTPLTKKRGKKQEDEHQREDKEREEYIILSLPELYSRLWTSLGHCTQLVESVKISLSCSRDVVSHLHSCSLFSLRGPLFTKKTPSYQYRESHYKPETVVRPS